LGVAQKLHHWLPAASAGAKAEGSGPGAAPESFGPGAAVCGGRGGRNHGRCGRAAGQVVPTPKGVGAGSF